MIKLKQKNIIEIVDQRAQKDPNRIAFIYLLNGEEEVRSISFKDLHEQAKVVAEKLAYKLKIGDRAILLYPTGIDFIITFLGCLVGIMAISSSRPNIGFTRHSIRPFLKIDCMQVLHAMQVRISSNRPLMAFKGISGSASSPLPIQTRFAFSCLMI